MNRRDFVIGTLAITAIPANVFSMSETLIVYRTETCGCCGEWVKRMISGGLRAEVQFVNDELLKSIKLQLGISTELSSCHTATISQYFVEGHVPVNDIHRLLIERPKARGLTVPGMPIGSPGMEMGNTREPFDTLLVFKDGRAEVFQRHA
tara:strand:+ start:102 stop:551 length:450 start_codon:yes stop_codon:yes gene_type:complete